MEFGRNFEEEETDTFCEDESIQFFEMKNEFEAEKLLLGKYFIRIAREVKGNENWNIFNSYPCIPTGPSAYESTYNIYY